MVDNRSMEFIWVVNNRSLTHTHFNWRLSETNNATNMNFGDERLERIDKSDDKNLEPLGLSNCEL